MRGKLSAAQRWALFRFMPFLIGDFMNEEIIDTLMAHTCTENLIKYLSKHIERFLLAYRTCIQVSL